jgi:hypothetical protein
MIRNLYGGCWKMRRSDGKEIANQTGKKYYLW